VNIIKIPEIPKFIDIINSKDNRIFGGKLLWFDILYFTEFVFGPLPWIMWPWLATWKLTQFAW